MVQLSVVSAAGIADRVWDVRDLLESARADALPAARIFYCSQRFPWGTVGHFRRLVAITRLIENDAPFRCPLCRSGYDPAVIVPVNPEYAPITSVHNARQTCCRIHFFFPLLRSAIATIDI